MVNQAIRDISKQLPFGRKIDQFVRFSTYHTHYKKLLSSHEIPEEELLIIGTIARSGTHYIMILLANYIEKIVNQDAVVGPSEMNNMFPNNWHLNYMSYHKLPLGPYVQFLPKRPNVHIKRIGLTEITRSHSLYQNIYWKKSPVLHLYRNPLDYAVSLYNYKHKKRPDLPNRCQTPQEVLELKFENYVAMYKSYQAASKKGKSSILRISYENLITNPKFYLASVLEWLGHEPNMVLVSQAVDAASIKNVKKAEQGGGKVNPDAKDLKGSFISSGQIGQWKNHFSASEFKEWDLKFKNEGIDLQSFILD